MQLLPKLVPPRVCAASLGTIWNRWCTHRRFQERDSPHNKCMLGCKGNAEDSIEHYCRCPVTKRILQNNLRLPPTTYANIHTLLLCNDHIDNTDTLTSIALVQYAIYNATNHFRYNTTPDTTDRYEATLQWLREGAKNHKHASAVLDNRWNTSRTPKPLPPIPMHI